MDEIQPRLDAIESKYLRFRFIKSPAENYVAVYDRRGGVLASLVYYAQWHKWTLFPEHTTVWSEDCLQAIREALLIMSKEFPHV